MDDSERTASLMTPAKLAQVKPKAANSPAAWLNQMASDAAHQHVRRIAELRKDLKAQGKVRDFGPLASEIARIAKALPKLDFGQLQGHGLWARLTGMSRTALATFSSQFERLEEALEPLAEQVQALQKLQQEQASTTDRDLVELEVEFRAIEKVQDQGARWLQDMRNQLKEREAAANDEAALQEIRADENRCEILVARLKVLRSVSAAALAAHQQALAGAQRRAALAQSMQAGLNERVKPWRAALHSLVNELQAGGQPKIDAAMELHRDMQLFLKEAAADCGQVQAQEAATVESLSALRQQLDTARPAPAA